MNKLWFVAVCLLMCVTAIWHSRVTYGEPPKEPDGPKMIAMEGGILLDANQILFVQDKGLYFHVAFKGVNVKGDNTFPVLEVKTTPDNRKKLAAVFGVVLRPVDEDREEQRAKRAVR